MKRRNVTHMWNAAFAVQKHSGDVASFQITLGFLVIISTLRGVRSIVISLIVCMSL